MRRCYSAPVAKPTPPGAPPHRQERPRPVKQARTPSSLPIVVLFLLGRRQNPIASVLLLFSRARPRPRGEPVNLFPLFHFRFVSSPSPFYSSEAATAMTDVNDHDLLLACCSLSPTYASPSLSPRTASVVDRSSSGPPARAARLCSFPSSPLKSAASFPVQSFSFVRSSFPCFPLCKRQLHSPLTSWPVPLQSGERSQVQSLQMLNDSILLLFRSCVQSCYKLRPSSCPNSVSSGYIAILPQYKTWLPNLFKLARAAQWCCSIADPRRS
jgi:hypothetical protein